MSTRMVFLSAGVAGLAVGVLFAYLMRAAMKARSKFRSTRAADVASLGRIKLADVAALCGGKAPGWVAYPEFERTTWINAQLRELWPFINKATSAMIKSIVEPVLEEHRPLGILAMRFTKLTLGDISPQLAGIKIQTVKAGQITMDVSLQWGGDPIIRLGVQPLVSPTLLPIELAELQVFTTARIVMELTGKVPVVAAMMVALLSEPKPKISYTLKLVGGNLTAIPGLAGLIDDLVQNSLADTVVWPKRIVVPVIPGYPTDHLELRIEGKLKVTVVGANSLRNEAVLGKSDPYVSLYTRPMYPSRTKTVNDDMDPVYNETFEFMVEEFYSSTLTVKVMDDNTLADSMMGESRIAVSELPPNTMQEMTVWLLPVFDDPKYPKTKDAGRGRINLQLTYHPFTKEEQDEVMAKEKEDVSAKKKGERERAKGGIIGGTTSLALGTANLALGGANLALGGASLAVGTVGSAGKMVGSVVGSGAKMGMSGIGSMTRTLTKRSTKTKA